jgi:hypothetical protein
MTNLVPVNHEMQTLQIIAKTAHASGLYNGVGGEAKILMVLLAAQDLGIKPTIALNGGIHNIQGKIEISARLMTSLIRKAGHNVKIKECNDKICIIYGKRCDNGDEAEAIFSVEDAHKAGLMSRDNWKKYTQDMLYARAMSRLARRLFPDVIGTSYVEGEIDPKAEKEPIYTECEVKNSPIVESDDSKIISEASIKELEFLEGLCDPLYVDKIKNHMKSNGCESYNQMTQKLFNPIFLGMKTNAEKYQTAVKNG